MDVSNRIFAGVRRQLLQQARHPTFASFFLPKSANNQLPLQRLKKGCLLLTPLSLSRLSLLSLMSSGGGLSQQLGLALGQRVGTVAQVGGGAAALAAALLLVLLFMSSLWDPPLAFHRARTWCFFTALGATQRARRLPRVGS